MATINGGALRRYFAAVRPLVHAVEHFEELLRREQGTGFSYAEYAVAGLEVRLNRILADLLNPRGPHGQDGRFLELFLPIVSADLPVRSPEGWYTLPNFPGP